MARWQPNATGRLEDAALALFEERGFEQTTVDDIATRAGLTKRTFFRHYADKREVLFAGGDAFGELFLDGLGGAPGDAAPMDAAAFGLHAAAAAFAGGREHASRRQRVIVANAELRERELVKLASVAGALAERLRERGVQEPVASLTAETAIAIFRIAFERWVAEGESRELAALIHESLDALPAVTRRPG